MGVELKKKYSSRERENADQLCCLSMSSLHRYEASIQSSGLLANKYCRFFLLPWQTYRGLRKAAQFSFIKMTAQNSYFGALTSTKGHCLATLSSRYCETYGCLKIGKFTLSTLNRTGNHRFNHQKPSREVMIKSQLAEIQTTKPKHNLSRKDRQKRIKAKH